MKKGSAIEYRHAEFGNRNQQESRLLGREFINDEFRGVQREKRSTHFFLLQLLHSEFRLQTLFNQQQTSTAPSRTTIHHSIYVTPRVIKCPFMPKLAFTYFLPKGILMVFFPTDNRYIKVTFMDPFFRKCECAGIFENERP